MIRPIPVVLCIDVEPDDRQIAPADARPWRGFEGLRAWMGALRPRLPAPAGAPRFSWFVRVDRQVAEAFGSPAWALAHYAREIGALQLAGDELGIHSHAYRWDACHPAGSRGPNLDSSGLYPCRESPRALRADGAQWVDRGGPAEWSAAHRAALR